MEIDHLFQFGNQDEHVAVTLKEVIGFPDEVAYGGGYSCRSRVEITAGWFQAKGDLRVTTKEIYRLLTGLRSCYQQLDGEVRFADEYGALDLLIRFCPKRGHIQVSGECREPFAENSLAFTLTLDQSYIPETIAQLSRIVAEFGDDQVPRES